MSVNFVFNFDVIPNVISEIDKAEKYIKIAIFQIHKKELFQKLEEKLDKGLRVELLTLPYDSINEDGRGEVISNFEKIIKKGAIVYFCKWNVGDPGRTTTAVGRWYSFHGKFIVTDKCAIALSANFLDEPELETALFLKDENKIDEFNHVFEKLLELFVIRKNEHDGNIREKIIEIEENNSPKLFELPDNVDSKHVNNWIQHYPVELCPEDSPIEDKLYITPFDCRGYNFFQKIMINSSEFVYICSESFTDEDFSNFLSCFRSKTNRDIKVICGTTSQDFSDRMNDMFYNLLAQNVECKTLEGIHAKLIITDKVVVISSINLNKINLGFSKTRKYWRENTETIYVNTNKELVNLAKTAYLDVFNKSDSVKNKLSEKLQNEVNKIFKTNFNLKTKSEVRQIFAKVILNNQLKVKDVTARITLLTSQLMKFYRRDTVEKEDFLKTLILYYLSERKQTSRELLDKLIELDSSINISSLLSNLTLSGLIEQEDDYLKIKLETLLGRQD